MDGHARLGGILARGAGGERDLILVAGCPLYFGFEICVQSWRRLAAIQQQAVFSAMVSLVSVSVPFGRPVTLNISAIALLSPLKVQLDVKRE